jgi:DDE family transposase
MGMHNILASSTPRWFHFIAQVRARIFAADFCARHRTSTTDFTRQRLLSFPIVMLLLLQKTTKSIQRHLHVFFHQLRPQQGAPTVSAGGWTQARAKLSHTAFIELNQQILLPCFYAPEQTEHRRTWRGHRLLGVDGSLLRLPSHPEVFAIFGALAVANHLGPTGITYAPGRLSVLYDLLNHLGLDARLEPVAQSETDLAAAQLERVEKNDVLIWDRGFTGFILMAQVLARDAHFVGRCSQSSFAAAQEMFRVNRAGRSKRVKLVAASDQRVGLKKLGLPTELIVRFVSVRLLTGELEVLVTSLLEQELYATEEFLEVYHWRWNQETYHQMLKGRLDLENWSGQTVEAVRQDVQAAVFVSNVESLLSQEPQEKLRAEDATRQYPAQVNRAVSYHALKERMLDLLWSRQPIEKVLAEIQRWMRSNPVSVRSDRSPPRRRPSFHRSYHYQRNLRKSVF